MNTFATNVVDVTGVATTSYTMTSNLTPDTYYARLRAKDSRNNYSAWTSTVSFTAVSPSSGGASSSTSVQEPYVPVTLPTTSNDTTVTTSSGSSTNIITKYIINPVRTIIINPLADFIHWLLSLVGISSQETLAETLDRPIGVGVVKLPLGWVLIGSAVLYALFGDRVKMPKGSKAKIKKIKRRII